MVHRTLLSGNDAGNTIHGTDTAELIYGFDTSALSGTIQATRVASGLANPLFVVAPPNDPHRLFTVEKKGLVKILDLQSGHLAAMPFLDVTAQVATYGENGLLGLAFHPDFARNGKVYAYLSNLDKDGEIREYRVSATDPNKLDPASMRLIDKIDFPEVSNPRHRGGWIGFGPDGYLHAAIGDGGRGSSPQSLAHHMGKILRLDVNGDAFPDDPDRNYAIPADNPASIDGIPGNAAWSGIYAAGLRNPFRASFDRGAGDLHIGDVGQSSFEEINLGQAGANYGWPHTEGYFDQTQYPSYTNPIHAYGRQTGTVVTGGYVYRGTSDTFHGQYFFGDFARGKIWTRGPDGQVVERTHQIATDAGTFANPSSFGEDALGNLYVTDYFSGDVFRLTPQARSADEGDTLSGGGGDDAIYGGSGGDLISGGSGADLLHGMLGDDVIDGGTGADRMAGGEGNDRYRVGNGRDVVVEAEGNGRDTVKTTVNYKLRAGVSVEVLETTNIAGTAGLTLTGNEIANKITGNAGANTLVGREGDDLLQGLGGSDTLNGCEGDDTLRGGDGDDHLLGKVGDDILQGGTGTDILIGSSGADAFVWRALSETSPDPLRADRVGDFSGTQGDRLNLAAIDANEERSGSQAFTFVGTDAFTAAGQVRYVVEGEQTQVLLNTDSDDAAEGVIRLAGALTLRAEWFVL